MIEKNNNKNEEFFSNAIVYVLGTFGSKLLSFLLIPFFSFYLTKEELGTYDLIITTLFLLVPFASMKIMDASYRWLMDEKKRLDLVIMLLRIHSQLYLLPHRYL